jgi:capsular exopolysaccharide synthesis family protein
MDGNQDPQSRPGLIPRGFAIKDAVVRKPKSEITLQDLWQLLKKRRGTFLTCLATALAIAVILSVITPRRYEATGQLSLDFASNALQDALASIASDSDDIKLQTQVKVLQTDSLAWEVIKRLRLDQQPEMVHRKYFFGPMKCLSRPDQTIDSVSPACRNQLEDEFHRQLRVQALPRTQIIEIRYHSKSKEMAAKVVNTMADVFVETSFQTKYQAALRASNWVSGQLAEVKANAQAAEEKFIAYQKQTGIVGTDENHNVLIERLDAINQQLVVSEANRIVREARYRMSLTGDPEALVEMQQGSPLLVLHAQKVALENQYAQADEKFGDAYPKVLELKAQLDQANVALQAEVARSKDKIQKEYLAALNAETGLRKEFEQQKQGVYDTNEAAIQVALLKRDVDVSRDLYEQLVKQLNEAGVLAGLRSTNVTIIDPARIPVSPVEPRPALNLAFGLFAGSLLGLGLCFLQENVDTTILTPTDVANYGALPTLGVVPHQVPPKVLGRSGAALDKGTLLRVVTIDRPESIVADAYRSLRTALLLSNPGAPPKVILVTSALPREGKTTTSVNTAVVFAQKNRRVLLVDGDLRRADLYHYFDLPVSGGLSASLVGEDPSQFYVPHRDLPNLMILPAGIRPPKPPDLLDSDRMRELIAMWRRQFDHVIIDAPPVIGLSDSVILATMTDTVVLVVRAHQSRRQEFSLSQEILAGVNANLSGAVINDFQLSGSGPYGYSAKQYGAYFDENLGRGQNV